MLHSINLLKTEEWLLIEIELQKILEEIKQNLFEIEPGIEDVHSQVEHLLIQRIGEVGKKIHSGRSRNDQVHDRFKTVFKSRNFRNQIAY